MGQGKFRPVEGGGAMNEGSVRPGMRWHSHWRWRVEVIEVTFMNVIRQALKDIYIQTRTHGQRGTNAQTHTPSQTHAHMQGRVAPQMRAYTDFFCVLHPVVFFNVERSIQFVLILSATKHQLVKSKDF